MPTTWEVMRYAVEQRNYIAILGLMMQQRWLRRSLTQTARLAGYGVVVLGVSLVVFCTVVLARDAVPAFAVPGTVFYFFLMFLVVTVSFNILFNYICAAVFSLRLGRGAGISRGVVGSCEKAYAMGRPHRQRPRWPCHDEHGDSTTSTSSLSSPTHSHWGDGDEGSEMSTSRLSVHRDSDVDRPTEDMVMVPMTTAASCAEDITSSLSGVAKKHRGRLLSSHCPTAAVTVASLPSQSQSSSSPPRTRTRHLARHIYRCRRMVLRALPFVKALVPWIAGCLGAMPRAVMSHSRIDPTVAEEIERIAMEAEHYTPTERRYKLLDTPKRFCCHCQRLKAPREHHCSVCNQCVPKMDHHCPFINNCVDAENQRYFFLVVLWLWIGTFLASSFIGYGWCRQQWYETWGKRDDAAMEVREGGEGSSSLDPQGYGPYGANGAKLTSFPVTLTLSMTTTIFLCMFIFVYHNFQQLVTNTTPVELITVHDKQERVFGSTSFAYRTPYDLGAWRNILECFRTLDDPLVRLDLLRAKADAGSTAAAPPAVLPRAPWDISPIGKARLLAWRIGMVWWLMAVPTLRPTGCDGVHYAMYDVEVRDLDGYCIGGLRPLKDKGALGEGRC